MPSPNTLKDSLDELRAHLEAALFLVAGLGEEPEEPPPIPSPGFDNPVGRTLADRMGPAVPPPGWRDVNPRGNYYTVNGFPAYHTGADLNWGAAPEADAHEPVFAVADGIVTCARRLTGTWGLVIVIDHGEVEGKPCFARYAHLEVMGVLEGNHVVRGEQIAQIAPRSSFAAHLHFDISRTTKLRDAPGDWPGTNLARLDTDYPEDPLDFLRRHRP